MAGTGGGDWSEGKTETAFSKRNYTYLLPGECLDLHGVGFSVGNGMGNGDGGGIPSYPGLFPTRSRDHWRNGWGLGRLGRIFLPHHLWLFVETNRILDELLDVYVYFIDHLSMVDACCRHPNNEGKTP